MRQICSSFQNSVCCKTDGIFLPTVSSLRAQLPPACTHCSCGVRVYLHFTNIPQITGDLVSIGIGTSELTED